MADDIIPLVTKKKAAAGSHGDGSTSAAARKPGSGKATKSSVIYLGR